MIKRLVENTKRRYIASLLNHRHMVVKETDDVVQLSIVLKINLFLKVLVEIELNRYKVLLDFINKLYNFYFLKIIAGIFQI